jgi:hypothetical protein
MVTQTQIVKVHIGDRAPKKKKRVYKRKPKKTMPTGTGLAPVLGTAQFGQVPIPAPFARQGWTLEPVIAKQVEAPPMRRIEQQPQMNLVLPPREIRDYMGRMLESQFNVGGASRPIIEEMPPSPPPSPLGRAEKPPSPLVASQQPPPIVLPSAVKIEEEKKQDKPEIILIDEKNPRYLRSAQELQEIRDEGGLTAPFLRQFVKAKSKAKSGEMSLEQIASLLGIPISQKMRDGNKETVISYILENA